MLIRKKYLHRIVVTLGVLAQFDLAAESAAKGSLEDELVVEDGQSNLDISVFIHST